MKHVGTYLSFGRRFEVKLLANQNVVQLVPFSRQTQPIIIIIIIVIAVIIIIVIAVIVIMIIVIVIMEIVIVVILKCNSSSFSNSMKSMNIASPLIIIFTSYYLETRLEIPGKLTILLITVIFFSSISLTCLFFLLAWPPDSAFTAFFLLTWPPDAAFVAVAFEDESTQVAKSIVQLT